MPSISLNFIRIDKWLWAVRLFKTRTQAADACRLHRVKIAGLEVKPSRELRPGEIVEVQQEDILRTVRVKEVLDRRVGAKLVADFLEDLTPAAEYEAARQRRQERSLAPPIAPPFRPSKRAREMIASVYRPPEEE